MANTVPVAPVATTFQGAFTAQTSSVHQTLMVGCKPYSVYDKETQQSIAVPNRYMVTFKEGDSMLSRVVFDNVFQGGVPRVPLAGLPVHVTVKDANFTNRNGEEVESFNIINIAYDDDSFSNKTIALMSAERARKEVL